MKISRTFSFSVLTNFFFFFCLFTSSNSFSPNSTLEAILVRQLWKRKVAWIFENCYALKFHLEIIRDWLGWLGSGLNIGCNRSINCQWYIQRNGVNQFLWYVFCVTRVSTLYSIKKILIISDVGPFSKIVSGNSEWPIFDL